MEKIDGAHRNSLGYACSKFAHMGVVGRNDDNIGGGKRARFSMLVRNRPAEQSGDQVCDHSGFFAAAAGVVVVFDRSPPQTVIDPFNLA